MARNSRTAADRSGSRSEQGVTGASARAEEAALTEMALTTTRPRANLRRSMVPNFDHGPRDKFQEKRSAEFVQPRRHGSGEELIHTRVIPPSNTTSSPVM